MKTNGKFSPSTGLFPGTCFADTVTGRGIGGIFNTSLSRATRRIHIRRQRLHVSGTKTLNTNKLCPQLVAPRSESDLLMCVLHGFAGGHRVILDCGVCAPQECLKSRGYLLGCRHRYPHRSSQTTFKIPCSRQAGRYTCTTGMFFLFASLRRSGMDLEKGCKWVHVIHDIYISKLLIKVFQFQDTFT